MGRYASQTTVSVSKTKGEIEAVLSRYGARQTMTISGEAEGGIAFQLNGLWVALRIELPSRQSSCFRGIGKER